MKKPDKPPCLNICYSKLPLMVITFILALSGAIIYKNTFESIHNSAVFDNAMAISNRMVTVMRIVFVCCCIGVSMIGLFTILVCVYSIYLTNKGKDTTRSGILHDVVNNRATGLMFTFTFTFHVVLFFSLAWMSALYLTCVYDDRILFLEYNNNNNLSDVTTYNPLPMEGRIDNTGDIDPEGSSTKERNLPTGTFPPTHKTTRKRSHMKIPGYYLLSGKMDTSEIQDYGGVSGQKRNINVKEQIAKNRDNIAYNRHSVIIMSKSHGNYHKRDVMNKILRHRNRTVTRDGYRKIITSVNTKSSFLECQDGYNCSSNDTCFVFDKSHETCIMSYSNMHEERRNINMSMYYINGICSVLVLMTIAHIVWYTSKVNINPITHTPYLERIPNNRFANSSKLEVVRVQSTDDERGYDEHGYDGYHSDEDSALFKGTESPIILVSNVNKQE